MQKKKIFTLLVLISFFYESKALRFTQTPAARISKSSGSTVELTWKFAINSPSELVRLECGYLNTSRQMTKLMEQLSTEFQPRVTNVGTRFFNRAHIKNGALVLTNLRVEDTGIYFCILKAYDATTFQTVTIRSIDSYLTVGGPASGGRGGSMSSSTKTTIIVVVVIVAVLIAAAFGYFFFCRKDRRKRERIPTSIAGEADVKNGNYKPASDDKTTNGTSEKKTQKGLTLADIEVVHSPGNDHKETRNGMSYSSSQAYESVELANDGKDSEEWPEPPTNKKVQLPLLPPSKTHPPSRFPPRVLPKPVVEQKVSNSERNEDMFV